MFESSLGHSRHAGHGIPWHLYSVTFAAFQRYSLIYWTFAAESSIMDL